MSVNVTEPKAARSLPFGAPNPLFLRDEELTRGIELLEQAHRALIALPEPAPAGRALGRNRWRALSSIGRHPGITMAELQDSLPLTKQSLSRLLKELVAQGLVARTASRRDRRQRLLELTPRGP